MSKDDKIAELEKRQRQIADELAELRKQPDPKRKPERGDVWQIGNDGDRVLITDMGNRVYEDGLESGLCISPPYSSNDDWVKELDATYLGKFEEVYMLRSEHEKAMLDFKEQVRQACLEECGLGGSVLKGDAHVGYRAILNTCARLNNLGIKAEGVE